MNFALKFIKTPGFSKRTNRPVLSVKTTYYHYNQCRNQKNILYLRLEKIYSFN